jgi:hypothetical protein
MTPRVITDTEGTRWSLAGCGSFGVRIPRGTRQSTELVLATAGKRSTSFIAPIGWFDFDDAILAAMLGSVHSARPIAPSISTP